jgi:hypothetical protein
MLRTVLSDFRFQDSDFCEAPRHRVPILYGHVVQCVPIESCRRRVSGMATRISRCRQPHPLGLGDLMAGGVERLFRCCRSAKTIPLIKKRKSTWRFRHVYSRCRERRRSGRFAVGVRLTVGDGCMIMRLSRMTARPSGSRSVTPDANLSFCAGEGSHSRDATGHRRASVPTCPTTEGVSHEFHPTY